MGKFIDLTGKRFGRLTAVSIAPKLQNSSRWNCICDCGGTSTPTTANLRNGHTTSCGCIRNEIQSSRLTTHGHLKGNRRHPLYGVWCEMRHRCNSVSHKQFVDYGGRGIRVCPEWQGQNGFDNFVKDMGDRPAGYSIDRIDNSLGYSKENCRWACNFTQANNTRQCRAITAYGETHSIAEWSRRTGISKATIRWRLDKMKVQHESALSPESKKRGASLILCKPK